MQDLISRQAAIDSFRYDDDGTAWSMDDIVYRLEQLPSAQPERKTGKWIEIPDEVFASTYQCSECGEWPLFDESEYALSNYCPNCGAKMKGEEHEN